MFVEAIGVQVRYAVITDKSFEAKRISTLIMVIELSGVQFGLKLDA